MPQDIRKSIIAGSWYPGSPESLRSQIQGFFKNVPDKPGLSGELVALIVPHAGYAYSGGVAAYAYKLLLTRPFSARSCWLPPVIGIPLAGPRLTEKSGYETPLGVIPVDQSLSLDPFRGKALFLTLSRRDMIQEHSLEIQLPFLQETLSRLFHCPYYSRLPGSFYQPGNGPRLGWGPQREKGLIGGQHRFVSFPSL